MRADEFALGSLVFLEWRRKTLRNCQTVPRIDLVSGELIRLHSEFGLPRQSADYCRRCFSTIVVACRRRVSGSDRAARSGLRQLSMADCHAQALVGLRIVSEATATAF